MKGILDLLAMVIKGFILLVILVPIIALVGLGLGLGALLF